MTTIPDASSSQNAIHLKISSQSNEDIVFKVKTTTTFDKIIDKYCERFNIKNKEQVRFLNDGLKIDRHRTPLDLGLEDGDIIECVVEQEGGVGDKEVGKKEYNLRKGMFIC